MSKEDLMKELEKEYEKLKKELDLSFNLAELNEHFFIKDYILEKGFVSDNLSNQIRGRIVDIMINLDNYLHSLIMPNPQNLFNINESKALDSEDKKKIMKMMSRVAYFVAKNGSIRLNNNKEVEIDFFNNSFKFWIDVYEPFFLKLMQKIEDHWKEVEESKE